MAKRFSELKAKMSPAAQARVNAKAEAMLAEMPLDELRQARGLSQKHLAEVLGIQQPAIAKLEKRTDMYLSTLRSHIEAMGGDLVVIASFPEGAVRIKNFAQLDERADQRRKPQNVAPVASGELRDHLVSSMWKALKQTRFNKGGQNKPDETALQEVAASVVDAAIAQLPSELTPDALAGAPAPRH